MIGLSCEMKYFNCSERLLPLAISTVCEKFEAFPPLSLNVRRLRLVNLSRARSIGASNGADDEATGVRQLFDYGEIEPEIVGEQTSRIRCEPVGDRDLFVVRAVEGDENLGLIVADLTDVVAETTIDERHVARARTHLAGTFRSRRRRRSRSAP